MFFFDSNSRGTNFDIRLFQRECGSSGVSTVEMHLHADRLFKIPKSMGGKQDAEVWEK